MKKIVKMIMLLICMTIFCCACGKDPNQAIIGYWMRGDGYTISFVDETTCSLGEGTPQTYKIYDENHLQIVDLSGESVTEFVFEVDGDTLKIGLATDEGYAEFTKNADEQKKILEELREWETIALEEQMLQEQINEIQEQIDSYWNEIADIQSDIDWNNDAIENNKDDILKWTEAIEQEYKECQEAIDFGDDREYQEKQRDDAISAHNEAIQSCNTRIAELETENIGYQESIDLILEKIEKLEKGIEELQEQ